MARSSRRSADNMTSGDELYDGRKRPSTPRLLIGLGVLPILLTAVLLVRILWEETFLTWRSGPQMIGFSLAHGSFALLLAAPLLLAVWTCAAVIVFVVYFVKKRRPSNASWLIFTIALCLLAILSVPTNFWQWLLPSPFARSPYSGELLNYAAAQGQLRTAQRLVDHGVPISSLDHEGDTPLHSAAKDGSVDLLKFLVSKGADVNALDLYGDSPLEIALARGHTEAATFLKGKGAVRVTGTSEQRRAASSLIVRRAIERRNHSEAK